jgi:DNA adenine methylase
LKKSKATDLVYCDPPYFGRHVDYFDSWNEDDEHELFDYLIEHQGKYILSTWHSNKYRDNIELLKYRHNHILTKEHFYHVGASENNRNAMTEALILNYSPLNKNNYTYSKTDSLQLQLLEAPKKYEGK